MLTPDSWLILENEAIWSLFVLVYMFICALPLFLPLDGIIKLIVNESYLIGLSKTKFLYNFWKIQKITSLHFQVHMNWETFITKLIVVVVESLSFVWLFVNLWTKAHQAPLSFTISWSLLKFMYIELVMLSSHLILCCPLLLLPSVFPSIRVFSHVSAPCIRWPKYESFSFIL